MGRPDSDFVFFVRWIAKIGAQISLGIVIPNDTARFVASASRNRVTMSAATVTPVRASLLLRDRLAPIGIG